MVESHGPSSAGLWDTTLAAMTRVAETKYHFLPLWAAFPGLRLGPTPDGWDITRPAVEWRRNQELLAGVLTNVLKDNQPARLVDLVPSVFARLDVELGFAELDGLDRVDVERLLD